MPAPLPVPKLPSAPLRIVRQELLRIAVVLRCCIARCHAVVTVVDIELGMASGGFVGHPPLPSLTPEMHRDTGNAADAPSAAGTSNCDDVALTVSFTFQWLCSCDSNLALLPRVSCCRGRAAPKLAAKSSESSASLATA